MAHKILAIIEAPIPREDSARSTDVGLDFATRFTRRVESSPKNTDTVLKMRVAEVRPVRSNGGGYSLKLFNWSGLAIEAPSSKLGTHTGSLRGFHAWRLAPVENGVHLRDVGFVVHDQAIDFDPSVSFEGHLLCADNHPGRDAVAFQQAGRRRRPLEALHLFPIPNAGKVHGSADLRCRIRNRRVAAERTAANLVIQGLEIPTRYVVVEYNQLRQRFQR